MRIWNFHIGSGDSRLFINDGVVSFSRYKEEQIPVIDFGTTGYIDILDSDRATLYAPALVIDFDNPDRDIFVMTADLSNYELKVGVSYNNDTELFDQTYKFMNIHQESNNKIGGIVFELYRDCGAAEFNLLVYNKLTKSHELWIVKRDKRTGTYRCNLSVDEDSIDKALRTYVAVKE